MRRQIPISHQLYAHLFPNPTTNDPPSFSAHLARNLVPEVRIEVATFYGDLNSAEARYPGLNYCHPAHRMRLGRFKHHRRLFDAFDQLGLTYNEIQDFCCWEGTRWARERYEKDEGVKVVDTTGDEIGPFVSRRSRRAAAAAEEERRKKSITRQTEISVVVEDSGSAMGMGQETLQQRQHLNETQDEDMSDVDSSANEHGGLYAPDVDTSMPDHSHLLQQQRSTRQTLHPHHHNHHHHHHHHNTTIQHHPRHRQSSTHQQPETTRRRREEMLNRHILAAWEQGYSLPPELEQWLKEQTERGTLVHNNSTSSSTTSSSSSGIAVTGGLLRHDSSRSTAASASSAGAAAASAAAAAAAVFARRASGGATFRVGGPAEGQSHGHGHGHGHGQNGAGMASRAAAA